MNEEYDVIETDIDPENDNQDSFSDATTQEHNGPRFDEIDIMFYMFLAIVGDIGDGLWVTRFFFAPATLLFLYFKNIDSAIGKNALAQGVELIPGIGFLPISTTAAIITIISTNHPEKFERFFGSLGKIMNKFGKFKK